MAKTLVIVESPAKAKTIEKFLGKSHYTVKASVGHVRDLPKSTLGVDIDNNFEPRYINIRGKGDLIKELKKEAKKAKRVYLATDPDREGEAISWHLAYILGIDENDECRIEFNEITKDAIKKAIKNPRNIDLKLVDDLHLLEPFGMSNPTPRFIMRDLLLSNIGFVGAAKQHLKLTLQKDHVYEAIGFNMAYLADDFTRGDKVDVLFQLDENNYNNNRKVQFLLKDVRMAHPKSAIKDFNSIKLFSKIVPKDTNNLYQIDYNLENKRIKENNFGENEISDNFYNKSNDIKNINIFEYFKEDTLVICNTLNGFFRAYSDLSLIEEEFDVEFGEISKNTHKIKLIFSPNLDKLDLNIYNSIILYDVLYNKQEYSYLLYNIGTNSKIMKYYDEKSKLYLNNIMENIVPTRQEFIFVYKYCITNKHIDITLNKIKAVFGIMPLKLFTILSVFREFNLLNYEINDKNNNLIIDFTEESVSKFNLDESLILMNMKHLRESCLESY